MAIALDCCAVNKQILITGPPTALGWRRQKRSPRAGANLAIVGRNKIRTRIASARIRTAAERE